MLQIGEFRLGAQMGEQAGDRIVGAGHGAVDAFAGNQQGTLDAVLVTESLKRLTKILKTLETGEVIQRRNEEAIGCSVGRLGSRCDLIVCHGAQIQRYRAPRNADSSSTFRGSAAFLLVLPELVPAALSQRSAIRAASSFGVSASRP
ncbi:hypothetical protein D3C87_1596120 [compost metagenome]